MGKVKIGKKEFDISEEAEALILMLKELIRDNQRARK